MEKERTNKEWEEFFWRLEEALRATCRIFTSDDYIEEDLSAIRKLPKPLKAYVPMVVL